MTNLDAYWDAFPSKLKHFVPAYWVDAERISVSGNFVVV